MKDLYKIDSKAILVIMYTFIGNCAELCITASDESSSLASTSYTFATAEHPELELLISARSMYSSFDKSTLLSPHSKQVIANPGRGVDNDDARDDGASMDLSELDPTCMVVPTSEKAYSGVSRYKDFVRQLPVHLSKYILSWVDQVSLYNCVCVSRHWRILVEEVHNEFYVNQHLWEEVMLMQVSVFLQDPPVGSSPKHIVQFCFYNRSSAPFVLILLLTKPSPL